MGRVRLSRDFKQAVSLVWSDKGGGCNPAWRFSQGRFPKPLKYFRCVICCLRGDFSSSTVVFKRQSTIPVLIDTDGYIGPRAADGSFRLLHH